MRNEWLNRFKVALVEADLARLEKLQQQMPEFKTLEEMTEAQALIAQAIELFTHESDKTKAAMEQMQKALKFQRGALSGNRNRFDKSY